MHTIRMLTEVHDKLFEAIERAAGTWLMGLLARLVFASVLLFFFLNSAATKFGDGIMGLFTPSVGAYAQVLPPIAEAAGYDPAAIAFFPWKIIVLAGTYGEVILPILVVIGLFTRLASLGMIFFIIVMSFVDISFHHLDARSIGMVFDRIHDSIIADQRLLWIFPLIYLIVKGPGSVSVDAILMKRRDW